MFVLRLGICPLSSPLLYWARPVRSFPGYCIFSVFKFPFGFKKITSISLLRVSILFVSKEFVIACWASLRWLLLDSRTFQPPIHFCRMPVDCFFTQVVIFLVLGKKGDFSVLSWLLGVLYCEALILFQFSLERAVSSLGGSTRVDRLCGQIPAEPLHHPGWSDCRLSPPCCGVGSGLLSPWLCRRLCGESGEQLVPPSVSKPRCWAPPTWVGEVGTWVPLLGSPNTGGRSGDVNPTAGLPRHGWEKWGRESRGWAPPTRVGEVGTWVPRLCCCRSTAELETWLCASSLCHAQGSSVVRRRTREAWATQLHPELEVQVWEDLSILSLQNGY